MRANFVGRIEKNHTTFIRIKTNKERKDKNQLLVLPVEVEVSSGTYYPTAKLYSEFYRQGLTQPRFGLVILTPKHLILNLMLVVANL